MVSTTKYDAPDPTLRPDEVRLLCRDNLLKSGGTPGYCPGYAQANVLILPKQYADDFRAFCNRNPVTCPLLGETALGDPTVPSLLAANSDIRTDCGKYCIYENGELVKEVPDIKDEWTAESVAFFLGCSYSFEGAILKAGLPLRHVELQRVLPVYKTSVQLMPAGVFAGRMAVSMRPYLPEDLPTLQAICRPFVKAHGEPVGHGFGDEGMGRLGVADVDKPDWGDPTIFKEGEIPVFWGCGVTPQQVVMDARLPCRVISHSAGYMLVLDMKSDGVCA